MAYPKLKLVMHPSFMEKLRVLANESGLTVDAYAAGVLAQAVIGNGAASHGQTQSQGQNRSIRADDLPDNVERSAVTGGFAGVVKAGRLWRARLGREVLGRFSSPEAAACARYYTLLGFRVGRAANLVTNGMDESQAFELAARMNFLPPAPRPGSPEDGPATNAPPPAPIPAASRSILAAVSVRSAEGDPSEAGPGTSEGARATPAESRREPAASTAIIAWDALESQAQGQRDLIDETPRAGDRAVDRIDGDDDLVVLSKHPRGRCPVCGGEMNRGVARKHKHLCLLCSDDFDTWDALGVDNGVAAPSFREYVAGRRGL